MSDQRAKARNSIKVGAPGSTAPNSISGANDASVPNGSTTSRPIIPSGVSERFVEPKRGASLKGTLIYRPALYAQASLHFVKATANVDYWQEETRIVDVIDQVPEDVWEKATVLELDALQLSNEPADGFRYGATATELTTPKSYSQWDKELKDYFYRHVSCTVYSCKAIKQTSTPGMSELDARIAMSQAAKEARDAATEKLRAKYADKIRTLQTRILTAQQRLEKQKETANAKKMEGIFNIGTTILGVLLGNKLTSSRNMTKTANAVRGIGQSVQSGDVQRAQESVEELIAARTELETQCEAEVEELREQFSAENIALEAIDIPLRKADTRVKLLTLAWVPWSIDANGIATKLID